MWELIFPAQNVSACVLDYNILDCYYAISIKFKFPEKTFQENLT